MLQSNRVAEKINLAAKIHPGLQEYSVETKFAVNTKKILEISMGGAME
jgi:hypothetical protein